MAVKVKAVSLPKLKLKTQAVVNKWVRLRDRDKGCICLGCSGKVEHASHYFNMGNHSALRYDPDNIHGSCHRCNVWLSGNLIKYRQGLVSRYGEDYVKRLEDKERKAPKVFKWHPIELEELIKRFK